MPPGLADLMPAIAPSGNRPWSLVLHGHGIALGIETPALRPAAAALLGPLIEPQLPGAPDLNGLVLPYDEPDVLRHVSATAVRVEEVEGLVELYREPGGETFWLVDERWGLCEINLLKREWRSWILPEPACDSLRLLESAVLWPMAQLLRGHSLHLIPAAAVGREGRGVLILSPYELGPELSALREAGVGIIGQRWVALREEEDRISLLSMPGRVQTTPAPRLLSAGPMGEPGWVDLAKGHGCHHAFCELVLLVEPMRRSQAAAVPMTGAAAREQLKATWPMPQLTAGRSSVAPINHLAARLARTCPVHRVRLSRDGRDLAQMLVRPAVRQAA